MANGMKLKRSKSVSFKVPKWKDKKPEEYAILPRSNTMRPLSTRDRLFLPYFTLLCPQHDNSVQLPDLSNDKYMLGRGRFGTVYKGHHDPALMQNCKKCQKLKALGKNQEAVKSVAIKVLRKSLILDQEAAVQIIEEIRIHSVCSGLPRVLPFIKAWQSHLHLYVAVELCQRGSLADLVASRHGKALPVQSVKIAAQQIHQGLTAIHNLGIIFRDIALKNILISDSGNLVISDFGLAKWLSQRQRTNTICGTLAFMAPEIAAESAYNHKVDLWSLGIVLYCLTFANYPFDPSGVRDHKQMSDLLLENQLDIPQDLDHDLYQLLQNLLRFNAEERFFSLMDIPSESQNFYQSLKE